MTWYVVDGMDGSGKTTSSDLIRKQLEAEGRKVLEITHPNSDFFFGKLAARFLCVPGKIATLFSTFFYRRYSRNLRIWQGGRCTVSRMSLSPYRMVRPARKGRESTRLHKWRG